MPELSIIMPLYNTERYVYQAIESLLAQTFTDFELIVVNDASTDNSLKIVQSFNDPRIKILNNVINRGIVYSRNKGLKEAQGSFIAPFDSDDMATPDKFSKQIDFLHSHPDMGMIGSWAKQIDEKGKLLQKKWKLNASSARIPAILLFRNYFVHSSIVMRREVIPLNGYQTGFDIGEDYRMWHEIVQKFKVWNYPEYLVYYRIHPQSATTHSDRIRNFDRKILEHIYLNLGITLDDHSVSSLLNLKENKLSNTQEDLEHIENTLIGILAQNAKLLTYDQNQLKKVVFNRWIKSCYLSRNLHVGMLKKLICSPLTKICI